MPLGLGFPNSFILALWVLQGSGDPGVPRPRRCSLGHYYSLNPKTLEAVKTFRDLYEQEMLSWGKRNCSFFRRKETRKVSPRTRLHQVALALAATESVLRNLSLPALAASAVPVLELLSAVRSDVVACMPRPSLGSLSQSSASPGAPDSAHGGARAGRSRDAARLAERRLAENPSRTQPWTRAPERARPGQGGWAQPLDFHTQAPPIRGQPDGVDPGSEKKKRMHKARRPESPRCREAEAVLSLLRLLTFDLKLAVLAGPCASTK